LFELIPKLSGENISTNNTSFAKINIEKENLEIIKDNEVIDSIKINNVFKELYKLYNEKWGLNLTKKDLTFEVISEKNQLKILFEHIEIKNPEYEWNDNIKNYFYVNWYVLVK